MPARSTLQMGIARFAALVPAPLFQQACRSNRAALRDVAHFLDR